jgi:hypothetical protein
MKEKGERMGNAKQKFTHYQINNDELFTDSVAFLLDAVDECLLEARAGNPINLGYLERATTRVRAYFPRVYP